MKITILGAAGGEDEPRQALAKLIEQRFKLPSRLPDMGETIEV
jgi:hypothetical protein